MTLTSKFKKDLQTLSAAARKEIYLDVKNPKLYKKGKAVRKASKDLLRTPGLAEGEVRK